MERRYSTADLCSFFNISKSTLFRWEKQSWFPQVGRNRNDDRQYSPIHLQAISQQVDPGRFRRAASAEDDGLLAETEEAQAFHKFLINRDNTDLRHLRYLRLGEQTIKHLLRIAIEEYGPSDSTFWEIIQTINGQKELQGQETRISLAK